MRTLCGLRARNRPLNWGFTITRTTADHLLTGASLFGLRPDGGAPVGVPGRVVADGPARAKDAYAADGRVAPRRTYTRAVDTHWLSSPEALAWAGSGAWSLGGDGTAAGAGFPGGPTLRPEVDGGCIEVLLRRREALWARLTPLALFSVSMPMLVMSSSTNPLSWTWRVAALAAVAVVVLLAGWVRRMREGRVGAALEVGGPTALLLATCVPSRAGWRLDLASTDAPGLVVAAVRSPVLGTVLARFADQEVSRAASPETLHRAPWRAWAAEPVLVVGGRSASAVTAVRGVDGGPWILSRARRRPARRARVTPSERQGAPA